MAKPDRIERILRDVDTLPDREFELRYPEMAGTLAGMDSVRKPKERRSDFLRVAVARELKRREGRA